MRDGKIFAKIRKNIENYLIFQPSKLRAKKIQRNLLKKFTPIRFLNDEGIKLYAWFIKPKGNKPVFLFLHGQAESILSHQDIAQYCIEKGYGLFALSYRGHYKSAGKPSEQGAYNDAQSAINQLKQLGVDKDKIIIWGHSLGSVVAIETAKNNETVGLILQSPIKEIKSAATDVSNFYCRRLRAEKFARFAGKYIKNMDFIQKFDGISKIKEVKCPILILHSETDQIAPCTNTFELAEMNPLARIFTCATGSHWCADWSFDKVFEFVSSLEYNMKVKSTVREVESE